MATVVYAWELGGGLGHVLPFKPIAQQLIARGHTVVAMLRDLSAAEQVFSSLGIQCIQAPHRTRTSPNRIVPAGSYAQLLHNIGFESADELIGLAKAWRTQLAYIKPDLLICDHSPTALLATKGWPIKRVTIGTGFCCPPIADRLPDFRPIVPVRDERVLVSSERQALGVANQALSNLGLEPINRLSELYAVDETFLTTLPELDHFGPRTTAKYWGLPIESDGDTPIWPIGKGPRVFAYLKDFPLRSAILYELKRRKLPTLIYTTAIKPSEREALSCSTLRFCDQPVSATAIAKQCDLAFLNGGHGMSGAMLLAGKPVVQFPRAVEQSLLAWRIAQMEAGAVITPSREAALASTIDECISNETYSRAAQGFAARHEADGTLSIQLVVERIEFLLQ